VPRGGAPPGDQGLGYSKVVNTTTQLQRLRRFISAMDETVPRVDEALPAVRRLMHATKAPFRFVGGIAVVHHGYARSTVDVDVLAAPEALKRLSSLALAHGFSVLTPRRLVHDATGVSVDLLVAGGLMPRGGTYPDADALGRASDDPDVCGLPGLVALKLHAGRRQDEADIVELLKPLDDVAYLHLEAAAPPTLRSQLSTLRADALEELRWAEPDA
jgi:hypothetical protein